MCCHVFHILLLGSLSQLTLVPAQFMFRTLTHSLTHSLIQDVSSLRIASRVRPTSGEYRTTYLTSQSGDECYGRLARTSCDAAGGEYGGFGATTLAWDNVTASPARHPLATSIHTHISYVLSVNCRTIAAASSLVRAEMQSILTPGETKGEAITRPCQTCPFLLMHLASCWAMSTTSVSSEGTPKCVKHGM